MQHCSNTGSVFLLPVTWTFGLVSTIHNVTRNGWGYIVFWSNISQKWFTGVRSWLDYDKYTINLVNTVWCTGFVVTGSCPHECHFCCQTCTCNPRTLHTTLYLIPVKYSLFPKSFNLVSMHMQTNRYTSRSANSLLIYLAITDINYPHERGVLWKSSGIYHTMLNNIDLFPAKRLYLLVEDVSFRTKPCWLNFS